MTVSNSVQNVGSEVAAKIIERAVGGARGSVAGLVVQPAVWIATGRGPDAGDAFIYGTSVVGAFAGAIVAVPGIITGMVKAAVDDHTATLVEEAKRDEPAQYRNAICPVDDFSFFASGGHIQSTTIASYGGVAWQHPNGVYVFAKDARGRLVCDYEPARWQKLYAPHLPLQGANGRVNWHYRTR